MESPKDQGGEAQSQQLFDNENKPMEGLDKIDSPVQNCLFDDFSLLQVLHLFYLPKIKSPKVFCLGATTLIQRLHLGCQFLLGKLERNLILNTF